MGHRLASTPSPLLERAARDPRCSDAARRAAQHEIDRRAREGDGDPDFPGGIGCEHDDTLWATAESADQHYREVHGEES